MRNLVIFRYDKHFFGGKSTRVKFCDSWRLYFYRCEINKLERIHMWGHNQWQNVLSTSSRKVILFWLRGWMSVLGTVQSRLRIILGQLWKIWGNLFVGLAFVWPYSDPILEHPSCFQSFTSFRPHIQRVWKFTQSTGWMRWLICLAHFFEFCSCIF